MMSWKNQNSEENFPFYAFTSIISPDTSSVSDAQGNEEGGGGSGAANAPVEGLYFFHTDHLGSVTMLTNTAGEVVTGTSIGSGRSMVSYTPYGEIDRVHSGGPDIYRYKYTGQEEDKETGLYYYKARYYDPKIGRFLQPDTVLQTSSPFGTNQYMYVEGNPVMYNDPSGHNAERMNGYALLASVGWMGTAAFGVAPEQNYTGGGGNCSSKKGLDRTNAYLALFGDPTGNDIIRNQLITKLVEIYAEKGIETVLDKLNTRRTEYSGYLGLAIFNNIIAPETGLAVYYHMTKFGGVKQPKKGVDRTSYSHDYSMGADPTNLRGTKSNNRWVKSAWNRARNPYDYAMALTGTVLFKTVNALHYMAKWNLKTFARDMLSPDKMLCGKKGYKGCKL